MVDDVICTKTASLLQSNADPIPGNDQQVQTAGRAQSLGSLASLRILCCPASALEESQVATCADIPAMLFMTEQSIVVAEQAGTARMRLPTSTRMARSA